MWTRVSGAWYVTTHSDLQTGTSVTLADTLRMGKMIVLVCKSCGHEWKVEWMEAEEARERRIRLDPSPPPCPRCGSRDIGKR